MGYFENFPGLYYKIQNNSRNRQLATNIFKRFGLTPAAKGNDSYYLDYVVKDTDRPDIIAHKLYDDSELDWLVLLMNDIIHPYFGWVKSEDELLKYVNSLYYGYTVFLDPTSLEGSPWSSVMFQTGTPVSFGGNTAVIRRVNLSLFLLQLEGDKYPSVGDTIEYTNPEGDTFRFRAGRVVLDSREALHHFESADGTVLDPLSKSVGDYFPDTPRLVAYINGGANTDVISNYEHEFNQNEKRRTIRLLRPERLDQVLEEFSTIFNTERV